MGRYTAANELCACVCVCVSQHNTTALVKVRISLGHYSPEKQSSFKCTSLSTKQKEEVLYQCNKVQLTHAENGEGGADILPALAKGLCMCCAGSLSLSPGRVQLVRLGSEESFLTSPALVEESCSLPLLILPHTWSVLGQRNNIVLRYPLSGRSPVDTRVEGATTG